MPRQLTAGPFSKGWPAWSHDGQWIYYLAKRLGELQIWKIPRRGGESVLLSRRGGMLSFESSDGKFLYYNILGVPGIWRVPVAGGEEVRVLDLPKVDYW